MNKTKLNSALRCAVATARSAGHLIRSNHRAEKKINVATQHDLKIELDERCQRLIERQLHRSFPDFALLGEEGVRGDDTAPARWVVDPIDGTVNFAYGIPHACVSIALQWREEERTPARRTPAPAPGSAGYRTLLGVVYDPFTEELWTAVRGGTARLNGRPVRVSQRRLREAIVSLGFAKTRQSLQSMLPAFNRVVHRVRKVRILGAAALDLTYVASGRLDAFVENGLRLWDIAAGGLILECAGGDFRCQSLPGEHYYRVEASNGPVGRALRRLGA